jgi:3'(2'), 5'-bisphosphate nucleotidase
MTPDDHRLAAQLADEAGRRLLDLRAGGGDPAELRKAGDRLSHDYLTERLAFLRPGDAVLSEEGRDDPARLAAQRVWIVDPLDGTREFGEPGRTDWAVHVALWESGGLAAGAVALPAQGRVLSTAQPPAPPPSIGTDPGRKLRLTVSRTRPPAFMPKLCELMNAELVPLGSAGAKAAEVISGEVDAYVHSGGQYEWDSAAPAAVVMAAGMHASRLDGSALAYNRPDPVLPDIVMCPAALAAPLLEAISSAGGLARVP